MDYVKIISFVAGIFIGSVSAGTATTEESSNTQETTVTRSSAELGLTNVEQQR